MNEWNGQTENLLQNTMQSCNLLFEHLNLDRDDRPHQNKVTSGLTVEIRIRVLKQTSMHLNNYNNLQSLYKFNMRM